MRTSGDEDALRGASNISSGSVLQVECPDEFVPVVRCALALLKEALSLVSSTASAEVSSGITSDRDHVGAKLVVSRKTFSVQYKGRTCPLGNTRAFELIERLERSRGTYLSLHELRADICGRDSEVQIETVQSHATALRKKLSKHGIDGITIDGKQRGHLRLVLE